MTDDQAREIVFRAAMRDYFYSSADVMKAFYIPTEEQLQTEDYDKEAVLINMDARDKAFNAFYKRVMSGTVLKADGTPYSSGKDAWKQIADDFVSGKGVIFRGTDNEGFVELKPENATQAQRAFLKVNNTKHVEDLPKTFSALTERGRCSIKTNHDPASPSADPRFKPENMDVNKPSGGGWWNKIVKRFTGHPSKRWEKYENFQRKQLIENTKQTAELELKGKKELDPEKVREYQDKAIQDYNTKQTQKGAKKKISDFEASMNQIKDKFRYDEQTKSFKKLKTEEFEQRRAQQAREKADRETARQKAELEEKALQEAKKESLKKTELKPKVLKPSDKRASSVRAMFDSKGMAKINKNSRTTMVELHFKRAMKNLVSLGDPDVPKLSEQEMAESLTTAFMVGEMIGEAERGFSSYGALEDNERTFGALAEEILGTKSSPKPITNQIKEKFISSGLAKEFLEDPSKLDAIMFKQDGMKSFVNEINNKIKAEDVIDNVCAEHQRVHTEAERQQSKSF